MRDDDEGAFVWYAKRSDGHAGAAAGWKMGWALRDPRGNGNALKVSPLVNHPGTVATWSSNDPNPFDIGYTWAVVQTWEGYHDDAEPEDDDDLVVSEYAVRGLVKLRALRREAEEAAALAAEEARRVSVQLVSRRSGCSASLNVAPFSVQKMTPRR